VSISAFLRTGEVRRGPASEFIPGLASATFDDDPEPELITRDENNAAA